MENSDFSVFETVLKELVQEQATTNKLLERVIGAADALTTKVEDMDGKLQNLRVVAPSPDIRPMLALWAQFAEKIRRTIEAQPKTVIHERRYLFFPETNARKYYRIVLGRLIPWGMVLIGAILLFKLGQRYIEKSAETSNRRYYYETYEDAWDRLDTMLGPSGRNKMKEALRKAAQDHR